MFKPPPRLPPNAVIDTVYYVDGVRYVVPHKCAVCEKCWLVVKGMGAGCCVHGGPYLGYIRVADE